MSVTLYGSFDLHSTNNVATLIDKQDRLIFQKRLHNHLGEILEQLKPYEESIEGLVVESTYNWYWLVDGLQAAGYKVHLANTGAIQQYKGLKHTDDHSDGRWLANLLRLGILPVGYIYPKDERAVRDLLRKRLNLVRQHTDNLLSVQNIITRNTARTLSAREIKKLGEEDVECLLGNRAKVLAARSTLAVMACLEEQIMELEKEVKSCARLKPAFKNLMTVPGVGEILALTIMLETGEIGRFPSVRDYGSYCRLVDSNSISNGKRKRKGNRKNGNRYLAWAYREAANFAVRYYGEVRRFYQRKMAKVKENVKALATNAVAHKLARASFYVMRDEVRFEMRKAFP